MKVLRNGKLVTVTSLKSDTIKPQVAKDSVAKPEPVVSEDAPSGQPSIHESKTVAQLKEFLKENDVEFSDKAKKADLIDLADTVELDDEPEL